MILKRGWHMFAQGLDKVDDSENLSAFAGACAILGARKEGACVFFGVLAPFADEVFLVGSFDGWGDGIRLERGEMGIWSARASADTISVGDRYKFKAKVGEDTVYLSDPYAKEKDGEPYFDAVYTGCDACFDSEDYVRPINAYEIEADRWLCYDGRGAVDYATLSRELVPYLLQMGYTHVCLSGDCNHAQGGKESLEEFIRAMHSASIGVLARGGFSLEDGLNFDGILADVPQKESSDELVHRIEFEEPGAAVTICGSGAYNKFFRPAEEDRVLRRDAAAMVYLLFKEGRMLTRMGGEAGREGCTAFDRHVFEPADNARFQRFCSELAEAYLSNPEIWEGSAIGERDSYLIRETRRCANDFEMILVCDLSGNGGEACVYADGEWRVRLDSSNLLGYQSAVVSRDNRKAIRISLPEYGAVLLERIK